MGKIKTAGTKDDFLVFVFFADPAQVVERDNCHTIVMITGYVWLGKFDKSCEHAIFHSGVSEVIMDGLAQQTPILLREEVVNDEAAPFGKVVLRRHFKFPDGSTRAILCMGTGGLMPVIVFAVTQNHTVLLVRQYRPGAMKWVIELPGGLPKSGQAWEDTARAELLEEVGAEAESFTLLGEPIELNPALETNIAIPVLANGCQVVAPLHLDEGEVMTSLEVTIPELRRMLRKGEITDAKSVAISYLALDRLGLLG